MASDASNDRRTYQNIRKFFGRISKDDHGSLRSSSTSVRSFGSAIISDSPTQAQIDLVRTSWERVSEIRHPNDDVNVSPSHAFGLAFYDALFELDPDSRGLFANVFQQARALTGMISYMARAPTVTGVAKPPPCCPSSRKKLQNVYTIREINARKRAREEASHGDPGNNSADADLDDDEGDPERLVQQMRELGARHYFYNVRPHHLDLVGPAFVSALKVRLGAEYVPEVGVAWLKAHAYAVHHMRIGLESQQAWEEGRRYQPRRQTENTGWLRFPPARSLLYNYCYHSMTQSTRGKNSQWPTSFRPIAPSAVITPASDPEKRKLNDFAINQPNKLLHTENHDLYGSGKSNGLCQFQTSMNNTPMHYLRYRQHVSMDQRQRRKEQNRAAQRAFRERKERYVKELETKIKLMEAAHAEQTARLQNENQRLKEIIQRLESQSNSYNSNPTPSKEDAMDISPTTSSPMKFQSPVPSSPEPSFSPKPTRVPSSAVACIRDKDGVSFCERLKEEVCSSAFNQLLSEPLFDSSGFLNDAVTRNPVPIVTASLDEDKDDKSVDSMMAMYDKFAEQMASQELNDTIISGPHLISCAEIWRRVTKHPRFEEFDLEDLCEKLKKRAKCSHTGPVVEEDEFQEVLRELEAKL
ncbi:DNA-binding transcription factor yap1 [Apophysomyces ossiformis]|uniref:DNA-binding transcription factor yap1 n=1 Tax=Apophysomyces ossiformis TaxID=679940 RepID=A0A8H7ERD6_9FUNG|nr:DNA-binding transcription factor yap1 [Apophysomyces ossiformis]